MSSGVKSIFKYLADAENAEPLRRVKVMFLGNGRSGAVHAFYREQLVSTLVLQRMQPPKSSSAAEILLPLATEVCIMPIRKSFAPLDNVLVVYKKAYTYTTQCAHQSLFFGCAVYAERVALVSCVKINVCPAGRQPYRDRWGESVCTSSQTELQRRDSPPGEI
jgi:hypothetical protein